MLVDTTFMRVVTSIQYMSGHDPDDGDGVLPSGDFRGGDYRSKFYAEFILDADTSDPSNPPDCPFLAVAITPAELLLVEYDDDGETRELARTDFVSEEDVWHTLSAVTIGNRAIVLCTPDAAGAGSARLEAVFTVGVTAGGVMRAVGVGVGADADYTFKNLGARANLGAPAAHCKWEYDALGRKSAEIREPYGSAAASIFTYDGLRQLEAFDIVSTEPPDTEQTALYLYGPGGLDDLVLVQSDWHGDAGIDGDGTETFFAHTGVQNSVVALTRPNGTVAERYAYAPFGEPAIYAPDGTTERTASLYNNTRLYTGRPWNADLGLYDYRMRHYDPALGRFITPDPIGPYGDWNNLGNPYAYVGNNPGAFTDPLGLWGVQLAYGEIGPKNDPWLILFFFREQYWGREAAPAPVVRDNSRLMALDVGVNELELGGLYGVSLKPGGYAPEVASALGAKFKGTLNQVRQWAFTPLEIAFAGPLGIGAGALNAGLDAAQGDYGAAAVGLGLGAVAGGLKRVGGAINNLDEVEELGRAFSRADASDSLALIQDMSRYPGFSFEKFRHFKNYWGKLPDNYVWHHIVEQNKEGQFGARAVHNVYNLVAVPRWVNQKAADFYQSKREYITHSTTMRVRDWMATKTYEEQREFGIKVLHTIMSGGNL